MASEAGSLWQRKKPKPGQVVMMKDWKTIEYGTYLRSEAKEPGLVSWQGTVSASLVLLWHHHDDKTFIYQAPMRADVFDAARFTTTGELWEPSLPDPDRDLETANGWLDRRGRLYPCGYMGHNGLAYALEYHHGLKLDVERSGYVKLQEQEWGNLRGYYKGWVTQKQLDTIFDYQVKRGRTKMPWWVRKHDDLTDDLSDE